jgi:tRNA pseudouridine38-40 synthase
MKEALDYLVGEHDFTSFCSARAVTRTNVRKIIHAELSVEELNIGGEPSSRITIAITGTGFLYNMVRIIVGTLLQIGENKRSPSEMRTILQAKNRAAAGPTALPHGLILWEVLYSETI